MHDNAKGGYAMNRDELEKRNVGENLDALMNLDPRGYGVCRILYAGSRKATGEPLTMHAAQTLVDAVKPGDLVYILTGFVLLPHKVPEMDGMVSSMLLARALVQRADILVMDEPTANLDYGNQQRVLRQIRALTAEGYTVLLSTHNPEHALCYADRVLALKDGRIAASGAAQSVLTPELIEALYQIKTRLVQTPTASGTVRSLIVTEEL